jgi:hypothetical protein
MRISTAQRNKNLKGIDSEDQARNHSGVRGRREEDETAEGSDIRMDGKTTSA